MQELNLHPLSEKFLDLDSQSGEIKGRGGRLVGRSAIEEMVHPYPLPRFQFQTWGAVCECGYQASQQRVSSADCMVRSHLVVGCNECLLTY